jgi:peptide/nickel transport system substrate-binding protein
MKTSKHQKKNDAQGPSSGASRRKVVLGAVVALGVAAAVTTGVVVMSPSDAIARDWSNKELRIGTIQEFENLNPLIANMVVSRYLLGAVDRSELIVLDPKNTYKPQAAERIPTLENGDAKKITENGVEKLQVTWRIRKEAQWGDGTPLTGKDYRFAWKVGSSNNVSVPVKDPYTDIERFEIDTKDPKVFTLTYKRARWDFFKIMFAALPEHIEAGVFKKFGDQTEGYDRNNSYVKDPKNKGLYTGPYRVADIKLGSHVELVRNEKWWGKAPSIEKIVLRLIPSSGTLESNLISGNIDYIMNVGLSLEEALAFDKRVQSEKMPFTVNFIDSLVFEHIDLNLDNPLLASPQVRQALLHAIDRESMVKALFQGKQKVATHFIHPTDPWFTDDKSKVTTYDYSPRKARNLLKAAGFAPGANGILQKDGKPFRIGFASTSGNKVRENVQVFIKNQLSQVGIEVEIKNQPAKVFFGETTSKRKFDAMAMYAWVSTPESDPTQNYHSKSIPSEANSYSGTNYMGWKNPKVDAAIETLNQSFDAAERKRQAQIVLAEYTKDLPSLPLYYRANVTVMPKTLAGVEPTSHIYAETYGVENWSFKPENLSKK